MCGISAIAGVMGRIRTSKSRRAYLRIPIWYMDSLIIIITRFTQCRDDVC